ESKSIVPAHGARAQITRGGRSSILLIQISKARAKETLERRASIIRRSVVNDDQLIVVKALLQYAIDCRAKQFCAIVSRHNHGNGRQSTHPVRQFIPVRRLPARTLPTR